ncbi:MAG: aldehyde ferredoxin oxidoreductase N-terminal domain-containing protein [Candidatus Muiribacteriota bacterium]
MKLTRTQILTLFDFLIAKTLYLGSSLDKRVEEAIKYNEETLEILPFQLDKIDELNKKFRFRYSVLIGYPLGVESTQTKIFQIKECLEKKVDEIIFMPNLSCIKQGDFNFIEKELKAVKKNSDIPVKIIVSSIMLSRVELDKLASITEKNGIILINTYENMKKENSLNQTKFVKSAQFENKKIRIRLKEKSVEEIVADSYENMFGGRNLAVNYMVKNNIFEYGAFDYLNKIVIAPGSFALTGVSSSSQAYIAFKSPLTEGLRVTELGGDAGVKIASLGIKALIIDEVSDESIILYLAKNRVEFIPAGIYEKMGIYNLFDNLKNDFGKNISIIAIGPGGEEKFLSSTIVSTDSEGLPEVIPSRGSGIGAVFGAKGIKAVVIDTEVAGKVVGEKFNRLTNGFEEMLLENTVSGRMLSSFSTLGFFSVNNKLMSLPADNYSNSTFTTDDFKKINKDICDNFTFGSKCQHCVIRCFNKNKLTGRNISYQSYAGLGLLNGVSDIKDFIKLYDWIIDYGIDPVECGGAIAVAREAGLVDKNSGIDEMLDILTSGDWRTRTVFQGGNIAMKTFAVSRAAIAGSEVMLPYDIRTMKLCGLSGMSMYSSDEALNYAQGYYYIFREVGEDYNKLAEINRNMIYLSGILNTLGICRHSVFAFLKNNRILPLLVELINELFKARMLPGDLLKLSKQIVKNEEKFNEKSGINVENSLPVFFKTEENSTGKKFDF